jgi:dienelactone hydrolase
MKIHRSSILENSFSFGLRCSRRAFAATLAFALPLSSAFAQGLTAQPPDTSSLQETVVKIAVKVQLFSGAEHSGEMLLTHFRPKGDGPFPAVIFNHGRGTNRAQTARYRYPAVAKYWTDRGFAFFALTRLGYGETGTEPDPEESGNCRSKNYAPMMRAATTQTEAALTFARAQAWVNKNKLLLVGQSVGGFTTVVASGMNLPGVVGAINFVGGAGGNPTDWPENPCEYFKLGNEMEKAGSAASKGNKTPMLWLYSENDRYWGPSIPKKWLDAYTSAGGTATMHMFPAVGRDGHTLLNAGVRHWQPVVDEFLVRLGFAR